MPVDPNYHGEDPNLPVPGFATRTSQTQSLIALTNDPALIRALQDLAGGGVDVSVVPDLRSLIDELLQYTGAIALIDAAALDAPIDGVVEAITLQLPDLQLMIAGHGADQQQLAARIANHSVFRFVHKPASPQRLQLLLDAAARAPGSNRMVVATVVARRQLARPRSAAGGRRRSPQLLAGIVLAVIAAAATAAWLLWPAGSKQGSTSTTPVASVLPAAHPQVAALLTQADAAFAAARYVASDGSSAAELYRAAVRLDPASQQAADGYERAIDQGLRSAEESLLAGRLDHAGTVTAAVRLLAPDNSRVDFLDTQISRELARLNLDVSKRQASEARQAQIRTALAIMSDKLRRGALLDPPTSSAVSLFREAEALGANDPAVRNARDVLVAALLTAADANLAARRLPAARRLVDAAGSINRRAPGLDLLRRRLDEAAPQPRAPEPSASTSRAEAPAPVTVAPVPPASVSLAPAPAAQPEAATTAATPPAQASAANEVVSARTLRLLRSEAAVYPARALERLTSGWVEMEFTVATDGSVRDISVTGSEPGKTFNSAAITALSSHRYAPVIRDGAPVAQRANIRMRFTAKDAK